MRLPPSPPRREGAARDASANPAEAGRRAAAGAGPDAGGRTRAARARGAAPPAPGAPAPVDPSCDPEGPVAAAARRILREVAGTEAVLRDPDLALYGTGLLDSLATVSIMAALAEDLGVEVSPAEFDAAAWATPRRFVEDVCARSARGRRP